MEQTLRTNTAIKIKAKPAIWSFPFSNSSAANLAETVSHSIPLNYPILVSSIPMDSICVCAYSNLIQLLDSVTEC